MSNVKPLQLPSVSIIKLVSLLEAGPSAGLARLYFGEARYAHRSAAGSKANTSYDIKRRAAKDLGFIELTNGPVKGEYRITQLGREMLALAREKGIDPAAIVIAATARFQQP